MQKKPGNSSYSVCLFGALLDVENQGCRALSVSLIKLILDSQPNAVIHLLCSNKTNGNRELSISGKTIPIHIVNYRLNPFKEWHKNIFWILFLSLLYCCFPFESLRRRIHQSSSWIRALLEADLIGDIRGGDSFSDIYGVERMMEGALPILITLLLNKQYVFLPQTYGPYLHTLSRWVARFILKRSNRTFARDKDSLKLIQHLLGEVHESKAVSFCPDVAFILDSIPPKTYRFLPPISTPGTVPFIGLNISGLLYIGGYSHQNMFHLKFEYADLIRQLLKKILDETDAHVLIIPHVFGDCSENDCRASRKIWETLNPEYQPRCHLLEGTYDQSQVKGIIGLCDFFIGSRMHACIAALSQGIPSVGVAYSNKFQGVFDSVGVGDMVLDARERTLAEMTDECLNRFRNRENVVHRLQQTIAKVQSEVYQCFREEILIMNGKIGSNLNDF